MSSKNTILFQQGTVSDNKLVFNFPIKRKTRFLPDSLVLEYETNSSPFVFWLNNFSVYLYVDGQLVLSCLKELLQLQGEFTVDNKFYLPETLQQRERILVKVPVNYTQTNNTILDFDMGSQITLVLEASQSLNSDSILFPKLSYQIKL